MGKKSRRRNKPLGEGTNNAGEGENLGGLLGAILGGAAGNQAPQRNLPQHNVPAQNTPPGGDEVLGRISDAPMMGQGNVPQGGNQPQSNDPLGDILGGMMGNAQGGQGGMPAGGGLGDILGGILGGMGGAQGGMPSGGMPSRSSSQGSSGDPMSDLLGSILGGGGGAGGAPNMGGQSGDPMGGLLGGLLGGMMGGGAQSNMGASSGMGGLGSILSPLADTLAEKTGIPREIAMAAMTIIVPMLLNKLMNSGQASGGDVLGNIQRQGINFTPDEQHEMVQQLSAQTGMDPHSASNTLSQAIQVLGSQQ